VGVCINRIDTDAAKQQLGLKVPNTLLVSADEVIE
jgi:hypothetical protein